MYNDYEVLIDIAQNESDSSFANYTAFAFFDLCDSSKFIGISKPQLHESPIQSTLQAQPFNDELDFISQPIVESNSVQLDLDFNGTFTMYDLSGKMILSYKLSPGVNRIQIDDNLVSGVYFYTIIDNRNKSLYKSSLLPIIK